MVIINQSMTTIVNFENICAIFVCQDMGGVYSVFCSTTAGSRHCLGTYENKDYAKLVLEMLGKGAVSGHYAGLSMPINEKAFAWAADIDRKITEIKAEANDE